MAKKKKELGYVPSNKDLESAILCNNNDIAFSISRAYPNESMKYYVEMYNISSYKKRKFLKIDKNKPDSELNRQKLTLAEASKKVFEFYRIRAQKILKESLEEEKSTKEEEMKKTQNNNEIKSNVSQSFKKGHGKQITLLESIEEIENENRTKNS